MSTPTGHHDDEPIDAPVRHLFWRLRARLVTPPDEQRAEADLDRLVGLARERAHVAPSLHAGDRPGAAEARELRPDHPLAVPDGRPADLPMPEPSLEQEPDDTVVPLRRGLTVAHTLGRVAAVAVMAVAVGVGVAGARDGSVSLDALLGRDTGDDLAIEVTPEIPPVEPTVPDASDDEPADGSTDSSDGAADLKPVPDLPDQDATEPETTEPATDEVGNAGSDADGSAGGTGNGSGSQPAPDPAPAPAPSETDEVVAAPPVEKDVEERRPTPDDLQGAGGPVPCEEDNLADCLEDEPVADGTEDEGATTDDGAEGSDDEPVTDDPDEVVEAEPVDQPTSDEDAGAAQDELAARRFGGDS